MAPRRRLAYRMAVIGAAMGLLMTGSFVFVFTAVTHLRGAETAARRSEAVRSSAARLEKLVLSLDEDTRALVLTGDSRFFRMYEADQVSVRGEEANLERLAVKSGAAAARSAHQIVAAGDAYQRDYLAPLLSTARSDATAARAKVEGGTALKQLATLHDQWADFESRQRSMAVFSERRSKDATRNAAISTVGSAAGALLLIFFFVVYLRRVIVRPVQRAAGMADRIAEGDLAVRMSETSPGEIGRLEAQFNTVVGSLRINRDKLRQIAEEQRALRRVATLVACGLSPAEVFDAVAREVGNVLQVDHTQIIRFEGDDTARTMGYWNNPKAPKVMPPLGGHFPIGHDSVTAAVRNTERPARRKNYENSTSTIGIWTHAAGVQSVVGCPVKVEGRVWGALLVNSLHSEPLPETTEARMQAFIELVSTAIANAQSRSDLLTSRARIVAAADESRRRIERDLHDGPQQRLVALALKLRTMQSTSEPGQDRLKEQLTELVHDLTHILDDLQEVSRGIIPPILARSGLSPALRSLARRSPIPMELHTNYQGRLPESVEVGVYYIVSEALTNVAKHAQASEVRVDLVTEHQTVRLSVQDDGRGGADLHKGSGLVGLKDRAEALGGTIEVISPPGAGTSLLVEIPVEPDAAGLGHQNLLPWPR